MLDYNVPGGKLTRGITVVRAFKSLCDASGRTYSPEDVQHACLLGWCIELVLFFWPISFYFTVFFQMQAYFLVADDIMDDSITRRGQPCWYRVEGVRKIINFFQ